MLDEEKGLFEIAHKKKSFTFTHTKKKNTQRKETLLRRFFNYALKITSQLGKRGPNLKCEQKGCNLRRLSGR